MQSGAILSGPAIRQWVLQKRIYTVTAVLLNNDG